MRMGVPYGASALYASLILVIITVSVYSAPASPHPLPLHLSMMPANWYAVHDHDGDLVEDTLEAASGRVEAYVILSSQPTELHEEVLRRHGADIIYRFRYVLKGYLVWIDASRIGSLASTLSILDADHDGYADLLYIAQPKTYRPFMSWAAREGHARPLVWDLGYTGKGVRVAVLDTGIDLGTRGFNKSRVEFHDLVNGQTAPYDEVGHGTMVSYVIAGNTTPSTDYGEANNTILTTYIGYINPVQTTQYYYVTGPLMVTGDVASLDISGYVVMYDYSSSGFVESAYLMHYPGYTVRDLGGYDAYWQLTVSYSQLDNGYYMATLSLQSPITNPPKGLYYIWVRFTVSGYTAEVAGEGLLPLMDNSDGYWLDAGVAPEAGLVVFKVGDANGIDTGLASEALDAIAGWDSDNDPGNDVNIVSMSFGGPGDDAAFHQAIQNAVNYGVLSVVAAGNDGPGANNAGSTYPAAYPEVLTVAAVNTVGNITDYSSQGGVSGSDSTTIKPDIAAPGGSYYGPMAMKDSEQDGEIKFETGDSYEVEHGDLQTAMGTSFATPFVSGVAALVVEAMKDYGLWANDKTHVLLVKSILMATAVETYPMLRERNPGYSPALDRGVKDVHEGIGMVDAAAAVSLVRSMADFYFGEKTMLNETIYADGGPLYGVSSVYDIAPEQVFAQAAWGYYRVFNVYNVTVNGSTYVTKYRARLVMSSEDPGGTDYDVYIYSVSAYNGDPVLDWAAASGKGVLDDAVTFTPDDGIIYYIVVKRAGFDVAPATMNLLVGPATSAWYDPYTHTVHVDASAASSPDTAQYAHIVIVDGGGNTVIHHYYPVETRGNGAGVTATVQLPYGIPGGDYTVYVFFTNSTVLSPSTVVEGPVAYNVSVPPPITITYSYQSPIRDTEPLVVTGNVTYLNGTPVSGAEINLYYLNGTLAGTAYTGSDGSYAISHSIGVNGTYEFYLYVPGTDSYQASRSSVFSVTVLLSTNLTISVSNATPRAYQVFYVTGVLTGRDGSPLSGQTVTVQYSEDGSTWMDVGNATTNGSGVYRLPVYAVESGSYSLRAWFPGNASAGLAESYSSVVNITVSLASTRLNITVSPSTIYAGEQVNVTVTLEALRLGQWIPVDGNVTIYRYSGTWVPVANVTVVNGTGSATITLEYSGDIQLRAYYPGNASYEPAEAIEAVTVLARPTTLTSNMPLAVNVSAAYTVTVILRDNLTGDPVPGAGIDVYVNETLYATIFTGSNGTGKLNLTIGRPGAANITLCYHGDSRYAAARAEYSVDARYPVSVSITYSPSTPGVGEALNVTVAVAANGSGVPGVLVRLYYSNGSEWVYLGGQSTGSGGEALFQVAIDEPGNYTFRAEAEATWRTWSGSSETSIPVKYTTTLTLLGRNITQYNDGTVYIVYRVLLATSSGDPVAGATVDLYKNTTLLVTNTTNSAGVAVLKAWVSNTTALGTYTLKHPGSSTTWSSETTDTISVLPEPVPETGAALAALGAATALVATILLLSRRRARHG